MLTREFIGAALISLVLLIAVFIFFKVSMRRRAQEVTLPEPRDPEEGELLFTCLYVSTVYSDRPLDRVWAYGLGHRGKCEVMLSETAFSLIRQGETDFAIPLPDVLSVTRDSATIDRGVESRGLTQVNWKLGDYGVTTNLRITVDQESAVSALREALVSR